ncbi:MAG: hypothetical protein ACOYNN_10970 [Terrimicrobiaceae bacterium]
MPKFPKTPHQGGRSHPEGLFHPVVKHTQAPHWHTLGKEALRQSSPV